MLELESATSAALMPTTFNTEQSIQQATEVTRRMTTTTPVHQALTDAIAVAAQAVYAALRGKRQAYSHANFVTALAIELRRQGYRVTQNIAIPRRYAGAEVGSGQVDLLVNDLVVVSVKRTADFTRQDFRELHSYLEDGQWKVGVLINFGGTKLRVRRRENPAGRR